MKTVLIWFNYEFCFHFKFNFYFKNINFTFLIWPIMAKHAFKKQTRLKIEMLQMTDCQTHALNLQKILFLWEFY